MWKPSPAPAGGLARPPPCGQLAAGTCEIVTLDRDSSQPRRTIARQTARCACRKGQIAGTTRARPACVDARIIRTKQWCDMLPCLEGEGCDLLINRSGWTCTQPGGRIKTTTTWRAVGSRPHLPSRMPPVISPFMPEGGDGGGRAEPESPASFLRGFDFVLIQLNYENKEKLL
ncbi:hypothetical protein MJG53_003823 [Ovis ammon polii x Ovis aries]|uniref:Uncharacterized protein n=1 Tax=Ovis ammon polii x Ovis aries TaxID=2918886 RepID=A0ACB9V7X1_9CETA|nr:hypothetical protein MJG53_003823 [Ovis ammon polii x Ovis aries]